MGFAYDIHYQTDREAMKAALPAYSGLVVRSRFTLDRDFLAAATNLQFIARSGVGVEHIDLDYCVERGIEVIISPEGSRDTVAEHALGMLLMLMNNLGRADRQVRHGEWIRAGNRGVEIKGKTVGILGYGNMGTALAQRLRGFDARVIAFDKYKSGYGDAYAEAVSLQTLWQESDILSIHIPYMPENKFFIDGAFLQKFAKPIYLVNTARGLVLHTADLVAAMEKGQVTGAALDVIEYEETSFENLNPLTLPAPFQYLRNSDRAVLTPHIAGWSVESNRGHAAVLARKIAALFADSPLKTSL
ncbi:MAG: hydroxyacid dehydrogenase [Lewinellaceae bacterium]|nr:hydroxyacid dehydrogenase [Lewinellaceae bacterium]